jgi:hypothetical protein
MPSSSNDTFSPEMIRILKIFGLGSLLFVFVLSFFNERRANNTGNEEGIMHLRDADRLFFKNVRAPYYDIEGRRDAKMTVYRYGKRVFNADRPILNFSIIINQLKDESYIYVELSTEEIPIRIQWNKNGSGESGELEFQGGDKFAHLKFAVELSPLLEESTQFQLWHNNGWISFLEESKEREALLTTITDYFRLINYQISAEKKIHKVTKSKAG